MSGVSSSVACVVIASERRKALVEQHVLPSVVAQPFNEVVVVADYPSSTPTVRWLVVEPLLRNTIDALVKRDVGTLATTSEWLCYLCDDHAVHQLPKLLPDTPGIGVPRRFCRHNGIIWLNMGLNQADPMAPYCAGHAGLFHRSLIQRHPWSSMPHHKYWDLASSQLFLAEGVPLMQLDDFVVEDLEPERAPWK